MTALTIAPEMAATVLNKTAAFGTRDKVARAYAAHKGWKGSRSGWIYSPKTGRTLEQGYQALYIKFYPQICEWLRENAA